MCRVDRGQRDVGSATVTSRAGTAALVGMVVASVLVVDPGGLAPFGPARFAAVSMATLFALALSLRAGGGLARGPMLAWAAVMAMVVVAAALGLDPLYAWTGTPERHLGALTWAFGLTAFVAGQLLGPRAVRVVVPALAVAGGLAGLWAGAEALGWEPIDLIGSGDRPVATMGSSAFLGAAMVLLAPAALGLAADRERSSRLHWAAGLAGGLAGLGLVVSGARAAWVGALVAGVVVLVQRRPRVNRRLVTWSAAAVVGVVAVAGLTGVAGRVPAVFGDGAGGIGGRLDEWRVATRVVSAHPLTGVGPEGYRIAFGAHVDDAYEMEHGRQSRPDRAHSAPLDVAVTAGLAGLVAYLVLLAVVGRFVLRAIRTGPPWLAGLAAGLLGYAAQSMFLFPLAELDPLAWMLAGLVVAVVARGAKTWTLPPRRLVPAVVGLLAIVALVAGVLDVVADRRAKESLLSLSSPVPPPAMPASELRPDALRYHLVDARVHEAEGTAAGLGAALADLDQALALSPLDPVARSERARVLLERARSTGENDHFRLALDALERLANDDPRNAEVLLRLGLARTLTGDDAGAEVAWLAAERLAPRSAAASTNLAVAYARAGRRDEAVAAAHRALAREPSNRRAASILGSS